MADLSLNNDELNRAALTWLKEAQADPEPHYLHLLTLAAHGLDQGVEGEWPASHRHALQEQLNVLHGWKPENVMFWLLNNPNAGDAEEQKESLLAALSRASKWPIAAAMVLNAIYSRQVADNPALQPASSELT